MAMMNASRGIRLSPGVWRNPNTGGSFNSITGRIPGPKIPKVRKPEMSIPKGEMDGSNDPKPNPMTPGATPGGGGTLTMPGAPMPPAMSPPVAVAPAPMAPVDPGITDALFPTTRMFEPKNYQGSPLYQFQVKQGQDQLAKSLAAKGLTNSGKAIRDELDIPMQAAAQDTDRMTRVASENADRLKSFQDNEALRREREGNNQWDRLMGLTSLMAQQSPWTGALGGLNNTVDLTTAAGQAQANFLKDAYKRIIAAGGGGRGGGGGGGGGAGVTPIPLPTGPDFTGLVPGQIAGNFNSNNGWTNLFQGGLTSLLGNLGSSV